jgi:hypothetical protein
MPRVLETRERSKGRRTLTPKLFISRKMGDKKDF